MRVDCDLSLAAAVHGDDGDAAPLFHVLPNSIGVVALVGYQRFGFRPFGVHDEVAGRCACCIDCFLIVCIKPWTPTSLLES